MCNAYNRIKKIHMTLEEWCNENGIKVKVKKAKTLTLEDFI